MEGKISLIRFLENRMSREEKKKYGAEAILMDIMKHSHTQNIGCASRLMELYENSEKKEIMLEMFFLLAGCKFSQYLEYCVQQMLPVILPQKSMDERFEYGGFTFYPYKRLKRKMNFMEITKHLYTERRLGMGNYKYDYINHPWNYEAFYSAAGETDMDIFLCEETGLLYLPGSNELFGWNEKQGGI